uniref:Uncharacterized protein n=1 Tax=Arundo donax TaxID=35708 RepID=A0A0A9BA70_ARUDO
MIKSLITVKIVTGITGNQGK